MEELEAMSPCADGLAFARQCGSLKEAWDTCPEPGWLLWFARRKEIISKPQAVTIAVAAAAHVLPLYERKYPDDQRPRKALAVATQWLQNPTKEAAAAAKASADAAYAAYAYAAKAVYAGAANAADAAANANAADAAAYAAAAYANAEKDEKLWQGDKIREVLGNPKL